MAKNESYEDKIQSIANSGNDYPSVIPAYTHATVSVDNIDFNKIDKIIKDKWGDMALAAVKRISDINNSR